MNAPIPPLGPFPKELYRVFSEKRWAEEFINSGRLRFRPVQYFADLEDAVRADTTEGHAHLQIPGDVHSAHVDGTGNIVRITSAPGMINYQGEFINRVYICCFSAPPQDDLSLLPNKFGTFVAKIADPEQLAWDLVSAMTRDGLLRDTPVVECLKVLYNKGEPSNDEPDHFKRTRLNFMQKPRKFAEEYEWRFAAIDNRVFDRDSWDIAGDYYDVVIGKRLKYASLFEI
ncbi:MAG: hypothetical protein JWL61_4190 [Gemmatimonadetes bacterium]|nr:hypothetical protein [Gemmatimonadota bacterium]